MGGSVNLFSPPPNKLNGINSQMHFNSKKPTVCARILHMDWTVTVTAAAAAVALSGDGGGVGDGF